MPDKPRKQCKARTASGKPCSLPAKPGGKLCATHAKQRISSDPAKRARQLSGLSRGRQPKPQRKTTASKLAEYTAEIIGLLPARIFDEDGNLPAQYKLTVELAADVRVQMDDTRQGKARNKLILLDKQTKSYIELLGALGLTPKSHQAFLDASPPERKRVEPVNSEERARAVADLLLANGALPLPSETILAARHAHQLTVVPDPEEEADAS